MSLPSEADRKVAFGQHGSVEFAVKAPGKMADAWGWKEGLDSKRWTSFCVLFQRLVETGQIHNETRFKHLEDEVYEFKRNGLRLLYVRIGDRYLLTNTLKKSGRKNISEDIERSKTIGKGHLKWEQSRIKKIGNTSAA